MSGERASDGLVGGHQALCDDLTTKDALLRHQTAADKGEIICLARRDLRQHVGKTGHGEVLTAVAR